MSFNGHTQMRGEVLQPLDEIDGGHSPVENHRKKAYNR